MADPRNVVSTEGIGYKAFTYTHDSTIVYDITKVGGSAQVGLAVTLIGNKQVSLVGDGEEVEGLLVKVEPGGAAVVQTGGVAEFKGGTSATLTVGSHIVGDLLGAAEGYVQSAAAGTAAHHVVSRGEILDSSDTTKVKVRLPL